MKFTPKAENKLEECYYYFDEDNARYHYNLFSDEEAELLFRKIELIRSIDTFAESVCIRESDAMWLKHS